MGALRRAVEEELTERQRRVFTAIVVHGVPLDALVVQLGSSRNAIYKTMFDARRKLRAALAAKGYLARLRSRDWPGRQGGEAIMTGWDELDRFLRTDPRDVGCDQALHILHVYVELILDDASGTRRPVAIPGSPRTCSAAARAPRTTKDCSWHLGRTRSDRPSPGAQVRRRSEPALTVWGAVPGRGTRATARISARVWPGTARSQRKEPGNDQSIDHRRPCRRHARYASSHGVRQCHECV